MVTLSGAGATSAQTSSRIRLTTGDTPIMSRPSLKGDLVTTVRAGTALEELGADE